MKEHYLRISGRDYKSLKDHLFPGDGKEAVAMALCGRHESQTSNYFFIHKVLPIPYDKCEIREPNFVKWPTSLIEKHLPEALKRGWAIVKVHSHSTGFNEFSETDNNSDRDLFDSIYGWMEDEKFHGSLIMLPDGSMFGRVVKPNLTFDKIDRISVAGDELLYWDSRCKNISDNGFSLRTSQTFGKGTTHLLKGLKVGVVGCSGTGSPTIEQLTRLGVGSIVIVDPDEVEEKNLNRILNTKLQDAKRKRKKAHVTEEAIEMMGLGTDVKVFDQNAYNDIKVIFSLAECDILVGCVDSVDGRHLLNQISTFYVIPYFDLGVKILADGKGGVDQICGTVHYMQPGGSSLMSRGVYNGEDLRAASMNRVNHKEYNEQKKEGYIKNVDVESPAVISINMQISSMGVNEILARLHPFRMDPNSEFAISRISLTDSYIQNAGDGPHDLYLERFVGRGDISPVLNMPELR